MRTAETPINSEEPPSDVGSRLLHILSAFIPERDLDRMDLIRIRLYVAMSILVGANAGMFAVLHHVHHLAGTSYAVVQVLTVICGLSLSFPLLLRVGLPFRILGPAFIVFFEVSLFAIAWFDGGIRSGAVFWMAIVPLIAGCLGGGRVGASIALMSVVSGVTLFAVGAGGYEFSQSLSAADASGHYLLNFLSAAVVVGVLSVLYEGPIVRQLHSELHARREAQDQAEAATRSQSALLSNLSHEFRTPLTAVLSGAEILREEADALDRPILESMERGARRLMVTLEDVIDLSRVNGGHVAERESVEIDVLVRDAVAPFATEAIKKGLAFEVQGEPATALAAGTPCDGSCRPLSTTPSGLPKPVRSSFRSERWLAGPSCV